MEIKRFGWGGQNIVAYFIDASEEYWGFLQYGRRRDVGEERCREPLVLLVENGRLV